MSFSFRNIFSPDDAEITGAGETAIPEGFQGPDASPSGRGSLTGSIPQKSETQSFLASELLPFIPKAIAAQSGIPMSKEIRVPLPADGSLDVPLSTLYNLCPELFASEITPLNDSVVTLPPRLGATPAAEAEDEVAVNPRPSLLRESTSNPFWSPVTSPSASATSPESANPFTPGGQTQPAATASIAPRPNPGDKPSSGFEAPPKFPGAEGNSFGSGFASLSAKPGAAAPTPGTGGFVSNPFESSEGFATLFSKAAESDASIPFPDSPATKEPPKETDGVWGAMFARAGAVEEETADRAEDPTTSFESIGNLLKQSLPFENPSHAEAPFSGFASPPAFAPPATAPAPSPEESPVSGFGAFGISPEPFAGSFAPFQKVADKPPVTDEARKSGPGEAGDGNDDGHGALDSENQNPWDGFAAQPETEPAPPPFSGFGAPASEPALPAPAEPIPAPAPDTALAAPSAAFAPPLEAVGSAETPLVAEAASVPATGFPTPAAIPAPALPPVEAIAATAPAPAPAPEVVEAPAAHTGTVSTSEVSVPAPVAEPVAAPAVTTTPAPAKDEADDLRDLELRAIFSTSESFTLSKVARKVVALPGIEACSLSTPGKLVQASRREENRLGNEAREMVATLRNLAKLTGLPEARTFTLQTDRGVVSLFLEGDCCVLVNHDSSAFGPGVREKLILIARCISRLRD